MFVLLRKCFVFVSIFFAWCKSEKHCISSTAYMLCVVAWKRNTLLNTPCFFEFD